jgi:3-hydroxyisobutyrate dehydrogenase-like beta-hydroxyacid dehydrogenase
MTLIKIGFVGFGEVASIFSKEMSNKGAEIRIYDVLISQKGGLEIIKKRMLKDNIQIASLEEVIIKSDYIFSSVPSQFARDVAKECVKYLKPNKVYIDLNSTSPFIKIELSKIIQSTKAHFIEGAILGAVGIAGSKTHILVTGKKGKEVAEVFNKLGMNMSYYSPEIGKASMFKMLRSIFSKGLEALILECLIAGKKAGIEKDLWDDITNFMSKKPFDQIAANWIQTHVTAYERRYHEIVQVVETMKKIGVEPIMTSNTENFFRRSLSLGLKEAFPEKPDSFEKVIDFISEKLSL